MPSINSADYVDFDAFTYDLDELSRDPFAELTQEIRTAYATRFRDFEDAFEDASLRSMWERKFDDHLAEHARRAARPTDKQVEAIAKMLWLETIEDKAWGEMAWAEMTMPDNWSQEAFELAEKVRETWEAAAP